MKKSLIRKTLTQFAFCVVVLLLLATPAFYWLTKSFYAEDMIDIIEAVNAGRSVPALDLEQDVLMGVMIQFVLIVIVFGAAMVLMMSVISRRLWTPFDRTLKLIEDFRLEKGSIPTLPDSDISEFARLNTALNSLMTNSLNSYRVQKEFTENASHELQTPLAVFQSKLDLLMQQPSITEQQAEIIQDLYQSTMRLSRIDRNLLLLAKMENKQFVRDEQVDIVAELRSLLPSLEALTADISLSLHTDVDSLLINANRALLESMVNNLVVNAIRHNKTGGTVDIIIASRSLTVSNTSDEGPLDTKLIFKRFYHTTSQQQGNGLGLAIVKSVCQYHGWIISYEYHEHRHKFKVGFL